MDFDGTDVPQPGAYACPYVLQSYGETQKTSDIRGHNIIAIQRARNNQKLAKVSDPLYDKAIQIQQKTQTILQKKKEEQEEKAMEGYTFQPTINYNSAKMTKSGSQTDVVDRVEAWHQAKQERLKEAKKMRKNQAESDLVESTLPFQSQPSRVEAPSKVKELTQAMIVPNQTQSVIYYNKGNYRDDVPSRVQRKLKNFEARKVQESQGAEEQLAEALKGTKRTKEAVDFGQFKKALHKNINKN